MVKTFLKKYKNNNKKTKGLTQVLKNDIIENKEKHFKNITAQKG